MAIGHDAAVGARAKVTEESRSQQRSRGPAWRATRAVIAAAWLASLGLAVGFGWFANTVSHLETPADPPQADAIIVLTGGQFRLHAAVDLLKSGKGRRLLISGVNPIADEDDIRLASGGDGDLFRCCVDIDKAALDTIGNAEESAKWVRAHDYGRIILVTNNYHMPRSILEMRRRLGDLDLVPYPVVNTRLGTAEWLTRPDALRVLLIEYAKYVGAVMRAPWPDGEGAGYSVVNADTATR